MVSYRLNLLACIILLGLCPAARGIAAEQLTAAQEEFFESKIRPLLVEHCYDCHSGQVETIEGGLRLDLRAGWRVGGDSGQPAIVPGQPAESPLIQAVRHADGYEAMPPDKPRLAADAIDDLVHWVEMGAPDPRDGELIVRAPVDWETTYQNRIAWWSLRPLERPPAPDIAQRDWIRNEIDAFILAKLEQRGLQPAPEADRRTLARRASFAITGLPPTWEQVQHFVADPSPTAYEDFIATLLDQPSYGEHWARHWMDLVHYADSHGYEWDVPAKEAWRYRDYLIRAFNDDLPYDQFVMEQIAGDLLPPRIDPGTGTQQTLIAPMALRLGERRHGDNAAAEGVTQEAMSNVIDTLGKTFLGTTIACAQCHDHKYDAIAQRDYYALLGVLMSTRWNVRNVDAVDPNRAVIDNMRQVKLDIAEEMAKVWSNSQDALITRIRATPPAAKADDASAQPFPETLVGFWQRSLDAPITPEQFDAEQERRIVANWKNLKLLADFTREEGAAGWRWDGFGMRHGLVRDGAIVVTEGGDKVVEHLLPAGRWSHVWSKRLAGSVRSPEFTGDSPTTFSIGYAAGQHAAQSFIVDHCFHSERMAFLDRATPGWLTLTAGNFDTIEGAVDQGRRHVYWEMVTKSLNNYFPPRSEYGGANDAVLADPRSWFGVTRVFAHAPGHPPIDELARFVPLFSEVGEESETWDARLAQLIVSAVDRWRHGRCDSQDVALLNEALGANWLSNEINTNQRLSTLVANYRALEKQLTPDQTIGTTADWGEPRDERLAIRGSYTTFGDTIPRGNIRLLGNVTPAEHLSVSGRLELAQSIADPHNPLTARVYVNRVWMHLLGEGLVRTPDDFGHLGDLPEHPELLDELAAKFIDDGWSTKQLIVRIVSSATWRQSNQPSEPALDTDPENRLWHHVPSRRLPAEAIRDSILLVSGRIDNTLYGPPIDPFRTATDPAKKLLCGPLDGNGRRSIYTKITLMEPPRFLAIFNQPIPKLTTGRRDVTNVPDQALALLNDPFVVAMAEHWSQNVLQDGCLEPRERIGQMFTQALGREPSREEVARLREFARRISELREIDESAIMVSQPVWQDIAHAIFNLKEFLYVP